MGAMEADMVWVLVIYLVSSFLNAAYFLPIVYRAFFCRPEEALFDSKVAEAPLLCVIPLVLTAAISVLLFFSSFPFFDLAAVAVQAGGR
jgi:multicomponent Na+:H+ antiporter subunit D